MAQGGLEFIFSSSKIKTEKIMLSIQAILTLIILTIAIFLFIFTRLRADLIALMVLLALGISGIVNDKQVFSGFSSSAVMTILGISMVSVALQQTGATNLISKWIFKLGKQNETLVILLVMLASAGLSLFMNNISAVGVLLPAVMSLTRRSRISPARLLMPLAFGTILGGMATLLTTANIIVSGALKDAGLHAFGLLDFFPVGAPVVIVGIIYMLTLGKKLLPGENSKTMTEPPLALNMKLKDLYSLDANLTQMKILDSSPLAGIPINSDLFMRSNINLIAIQSGKILKANPQPTTLLKSGDILLLGNFQADQTALGLARDFTDLSNQVFSDDSHSLAELVLAPHASLLGKTLTEIRFKSKYDLNVLSVWRDGKPISNQIKDLPLRFGDALLVQGSAQNIHRLHDQNDLILLEENPDAVIRPQKQWIAIVITLVTLGFAATNILPVAEIVLLGAVLLMLSGCMGINDVFQSIEWKAIFLIAGMWPLSIAIQQTGLATALISVIIRGFGSISPLLLVTIFLFLAMIFTQLMSGQISAIVLIPLALTASSTMHVSPQAMAMAVALGCSLGFPTPLGHPVNIMVMNPGGYTFKDYLRVGLPLTFLAFATILLGIHFVYGL